MSEKNWIKNSIKFLFDNIVQIIFGSIITLTSIVYYKDKLIEFFNYTVNIWQVSIFLLIIAVSISSYDFYKSKSVHKFLKYGMEWHVNIKKHSIIKKDIEISVKGPFCPRCLLEMTESKPFQCLSCNKQYTALNSTNVEEAQGIVKKIIEAEIRGGKLLILDWSTSTIQYPDSHFNIKNNGASIASNISIQINLLINNEIKDIGSYNIEKIEPDKTKKIENPDPMINVNKVLREKNLIWVEEEDIEDFEEDEWGRPYLGHTYMRWLTLQEEFSCKLEVNINYSLKNKIIKKHNIYSFKFIFRVPNTPFGFEQYEDNCEINMNQIE
jgi:hypothetical protein